jgi:3-hydroxybutyrate dehydrogenase
MSELHGKVAIVTGAGSGIGRAIACEFAAAGAHVALAGRREARLDETKSLIESDGGAASVHPTDVNDDQSVKSLTDAAAAVTGRIDVLVNNAGITATSDASPDSLAQNLAVIDTNLNAVLRVVTLALPQMADGGRIINIASLLGMQPKPRSVAYTTSKHGVIGLTKSFALDLAPRRITVNAICPGWVDTEMSKRVMAALAREQAISTERMTQIAASQMPLGRMIEASEVAAVARFLASPAASMITGQSVTICGGSSLV